MATTEITADALTATGYNLTDSADFTTLSTGAGNGVEFEFDPTDIIILKNGSGMEATYTFKVPGPATFSDKGVTVPDATVVVADGKTWAYKATKIFQQSDGNMIVECDEAAEILILSTQ